MRHLIKKITSQLVYYKNVLKYTDEVETNFINARLEISHEKIIPEQKRRKLHHNILIIVIIIAILSAIGYLNIIHLF